MSQKTNRIYSLLSNTFIYSLIQKVFSGSSFRKHLVKKYITRPNVNVLDIGCGPAEILDYLPQVKYFGYDINSSYINFAKKKYKKRGKFYCKKFTSKDLKKLPKFEHILLFGILHHLNDVEVKKLMSLIKRSLKKRGNVITVEPILTKHQNPIAKFIIKRDRGENVRSDDGYLRIVRNYFKKINSKIYNQKFLPYTWFVMVFKK